MGGRYLGIVALCAFVHSAWSQDGLVQDDAGRTIPAPSVDAQRRFAPVDRPLLAHSRSETARMSLALLPFVEMGRASYPDARDKFLGGLPDGYQFSVRMAVFDSHGRSENVFVLVDSIDAGMIHGVISSDLSLVSEYALGDVVVLPEEDLRDWTIVAPDGSEEEGNFVGRFLDHYRPGKWFGAVFAFSVSKSDEAQNIRLERVIGGSSEPINLDLPPSWVEAAMRKIAVEQHKLRIGRKATSSNEFFVPFIYDPDRPEAVIALDESSVTA